jgi:hypothetical protein
LANIESSIIKRTYFDTEAKKLKKFEIVLNNASKVFSISPNDNIVLSSKYKNVELLNAFHGNTDVVYTKGLGTYCLYHGNLSVGENNDAALFLTNKIFNGLNIPLLIAGSKPSKTLIKAVSKNKLVTLKVDVSDVEMADLVVNAQINILPTKQNTGIKLKLINALFNGRHCLVSELMVENTGLESLCVSAKTKDRFIELVKEMMHTPYPKSEVLKREKILKSFVDIENAKKIIAVI